MLLTNAFVIPCCFPVYSNSTLEKVRNYETLEKSYLLLFCQLSYFLFQGFGHAVLHLGKINHHFIYKTG